MSKIYISQRNNKIPCNLRIKESTSQKTNKKEKRVRLIKNIEKPSPGFKPDPERWLPKWQKKRYKKKGKIGENKTQGLSAVSM